MIAAADPGTTAAGAVVICVAIVAFLLFAAFVIWRFTR